MKCSALLLVIIDVSICNKKPFEKGSLQWKLPLEALTTRPNKNMVVSTLPLRFSFCMLATAADDDTKNELLLALGLEKHTKVTTCYSELKYILERLEEADLIIVNNMYVDYINDFDIKIFNNSSDDFGVRVQKVGFNYPKYATSFINKWIDSTTYKRITDVLGPNDITQESSILLVSAIFLKTTWEFPFDIRLTKDMKFHHFDHKISYMPMIVTTDSFMYYYDDKNNLKVLNIKMGPQGTSVTFILPENVRRLPDLLTDLAKEKHLLKSIKDKMRYSFIRVTLPRFKIKTAFDWTELLQQFASERIFNTTYSGLNGMLNKNSQTKNVYLSTAKQKNFLQLDEMGVFRHIEGVRIPYLPITELPEGPNLQEFLADRPFFFSVDLEPKPGVVYELFHGVFYGTD